MEDRFYQQETSATPASGGFMQYSEEDSVYEDAAYASYFRRPEPETEGGSKKKRVFVMVLSAILCITILVSGILYAIRRIPSGAGANTPDIGASGNATPEVTTEIAREISAGRSLTVERSLLVFRTQDETGWRTVTEIAYDTLLAPNGPGSLTKVLAAESEKTETFFRDESEIRKRLNDMETPAGEAGGVYRQESDLRIDRADEAMVSFVRTDRILQEPHAPDSISYSAVNLDTVSGEAVEADQIIKDRQALYAAVMAELRRDAGIDTVLSVHPEIADEIRSALENAPVFTLDTEGMHLFFPSTLGKGLIGAREVYLPFAGNDGVFSENSYTLSEKEPIPFGLNRAPMKEEIYDLETYAERTAQYS